MSTKLKQNISISYMYNFFLQLNITSAIWVLYLAIKDMSLIEIGMLIFLLLKLRKHKSREMKEEISF